MRNKKLLNQKRSRRKNRNRVKVLGSAEMPRLAVFRSNYFIYAQLIDDKKGITMASASSRELPKEKQKLNKSTQATLVGELIGERALKAGVKKASFDRRAYKYHGRVSYLAEGARKAGLKI